MYRVFSPPSAVDFPRENLIDLLQADVRAWRRSGVDWVFEKVVQPKAASKSSLMHAKLELGGTNQQQVLGREGRGRGLTAFVTVS